MVMPSVCIGMLRFYRCGAAWLHPQPAHCDSRTAGPWHWQDRAGLWRFVSSLRCVSLSKEVGCCGPTGHQKLAEVDYSLLFGARAVMAWWSREGVCEAAAAT